jgi:hypothetical protein
MKIAAVVGLSVVGLLLASPAPANAQHGHDDERHGGSQKERGNDHQKEHGRSSERSDGRQANGPERRAEERGHEQHADQRRPEHQQRADQRRPERQEREYQPAHGPEHFREVSRREPERNSRPRDVWQDHRAQHWQGEHRGWRERGGYRGYRIPDDRFRAHFGRAHCFRVHRNPIIVVDGYPRFQYVGFWFSLVDPWPEYWSRTWYETDDVYVDYVNDGYYLYNRRDPKVAIAVNVSF